jgi:hypothetical protein
MALLDSGASANFISVNFLQKNCLSYTEISENLPIKVALDTTDKHKILGYTELNMHHPTGEEKRTFFVLNLQGWEVILGIPFIREHAHEIDWNTGTLNIELPKDEVGKTLNTENTENTKDTENTKNTENTKDTENTKNTENIKKILNQQEKTLEVPHTDIVPEKQMQINVIDAVHCNRLLKKSANIPILAMIYPGEKDDNDAHIPDSINEIIQEYSDVFPDDLPQELPPKRNVDHRIILLPGSEPSQNSKNSRNKLKKCLNMVKSDPPHHPMELLFSLSKKRMDL